jgi:hypothetical protein
VSVTFRPAGAGARTGTLNVASAAGTQSAALTGTGGAATITVTPAIGLTFPNTDVSAASALQTVTVTAGGDVPLTVTGVSLTGANATDYVFTNNCTAAVAPAGTCTIQVGFKPLAAGTKTATLSIASSASATATTRTLTGTAVTPPVNLALNKVVTASSSLEAAPWGRAKAVDGVLTSTATSLGWTSTSATGANHSEFFQVDLGTSTAINQVSLFPRSDAGNVGQGYPVNFTIQTSTDGITFTTRSTVTAAPLPTVAQNFTFASVTARYVRINATSLRANPNDGNQFRMQLAELGVYGVADTTPPAVTAVAASGSGTSATVTWTTDEASTSVVQYGTSAAALTSTATGTSNVTAHSVALTGLTAGTQYFYRVTSADAAGNSVTSPVTTGAPATFTMPGGATGNLALNKIVTASSSLESAPWGRARAVDGVFTSTAASLGWTSTSATGANHSEFFQVDLGTSQALKQVSLFPRSDAGNAGQGYPVNFTIQTSTDGITFTTRATVTAAALPTVAQHFAFATATARYVRINATSLRSNPNDGNQFRMQLAEVGVY